MSLATATTEMFRMVESLPDEISIVIIKVGCIHITDERPHEFTPFEQGILSDPAKYIVGYTGQRVNLFVLLIDGEYSREESLYPKLVENRAHYTWATAGLPERVLHTCVIPTDVSECEFMTIFADFDELKAPLCSVVFMDFCGAFINMKVENPRIFTDLPGDCFTDVRAIIYNVIFNIKEGVMAPFRIDDGISSDGLNFVNSDVAPLYYDAVATMIQQFMYVQRKKFTILGKVVSGIDLVSSITNEGAEYRFRIDNVRAHLGTPGCVIENLCYRISKPIVKAFIKQNVDNWLATEKKHSVTILDLIREIYLGIIADILKVNLVADYCIRNGDDIPNFKFVARNVEDQFPFKTTSGGESYSLSF